MHPSRHWEQLTAIQALQFELLEEAAKGSHGWKARNRFRSSGAPDGLLRGKAAINQMVTAGDETRRI